MSGTITHRQTGAMGHVLYTTTRGQYLWSGRGSRLLMIFGSSLVTIDHRTASDSYERERDARAALNRFLATLSDTP